jgi:hypothetical protein
MGGGKLACVTTQANVSDIYRRSMGTMAGSAPQHIACLRTLASSQLLGMAHHLEALIPRQEEDGEYVFELLAWMKVCNSGSAIRYPYGTIQMTLLAHTVPFADR